MYRDYSYTSSITAFMKDLNWHPLDQICIDSRDKMLYKVTYDFVAIPHPSTSSPVKKNYTRLQDDFSYYVSLTSCFSNFGPELGS